MTQPDIPDSGDIPTLARETDWSDQPKAAKAARTRGISEKELRVSPSATR